MSESAKSYRLIPSLDGLRAVSISIVMYNHYVGIYLPSDSIWKWIIPFSGAAGVGLFFLISGFLITTLLLRERSKAGRVDLKLFYVRRFLRIFPPFYTYLLVVGLFSLMGFIELTPRSYLMSGLYLYNLYNGPQIEALGHTWSLAIEEQFYLLWPPIVALLSLPLSGAAVISGILAWPVLRWLKNGQLGSTDPHQAMELTGFDTILVGVALALLLERVPHAGQRGIVSRPWVFCASLFCLWGLYIGHRSVPSRWTVLLPWTRDLLMTYQLWWCMSYPKGVVGRVLNSSFFRHIGALSYSLYLWQQLFLGTSNWYNAFPANVLLAYALARVSFEFVEKPAQSLRERFRT